MFRATLFPSSGVYQLQQQPLAAAAVDKLLMMGIRMPETL